LLSVCLVIGATALCYYLQRPRLSALESELQSKLRDLRLQAVKLNTPKTFSKWAKNQRQVHKLEKQIVALQENDRQDKTVLWLFLPYLPWLVLLVVFPWQYPAVCTLTPFFLLPGNVLQSVPMAYWMLVCFTVTQRVIR